jgi:hypothetical protein
MGRVSAGGSEGDDGPVDGGVRWGGCTTQADTAKIAMSAGIPRCQIPTILFIAAA